jgi:hypothetical protein
MRKECPFLNDEYDYGKNIAVTPNILLMSSIISFNLGIIKFLTNKA